MISDKPAYLFSIRPLPSVYSSVPLTLSLTHTHTCAHCLHLQHCVATHLCWISKLIQTLSKSQGVKLSQEKMWSGLYKKKFFEIVYELQFRCQCVLEGSWVCFHHLSVGPQRKWKEKAAAVWLYILHDTQHALCPCGQHNTLQCTFS